MSAIGYPDWQRVVNWDGPVLWQPPGTPFSSILFSPVLDVSRYHLTALFLQLTGGEAQVTVVWYFDQGGTMQAGRRVFFTNRNVANGNWLRMVNQGSFVQIEIEPLQAGTVTPFIRVSGSNRTGPTEVTPPNDMLAQQAFSPLAGNTSVDVWANYMFAGPVSIWFNVPASGWELEVFTADRPTTTYPIFNVLSSGAGDITAKIVLPLSACKFQVHNTTVAAGQYSLAVVPSDTGST